jgi:23S rRNA pseudouridine1911/1915/1917 synthase
MPETKGQLTLQLMIEIKSGLVRLDQAMLDELRRKSLNVSRNQLKTLFDEKRITLNGVSRPGSWSLLPGTYHIEIQGLEAAAGGARPSTQGSFLPVVFEDDELLVLNKRSGIPSMPHSSTETETAVGSALAHFPGLGGVGRGELEPGLLHRLDTGTSGLLAFAKTPEAYAHFHEAWKTGGVRKIYRAWVEGSAEGLKLPLSLELTLAHHPESQKRMIVLPEGEKRKHRGKPLLTHTIIRKVFGYARSEAAVFSDLEIEIKTGVMHQIRCTLAHLGLPILGDPIYNSGSGFQTRLLLHAWKLELPRSKGQKPLELTAPLPADLQAPGSGS